MNKMVLNSDTWKKEKNHSACELHGWRQAEAPQSHIGRHPFWRFGKDPEGWSFRGGRGWVGWGKEIRHVGHDFEEPWRWCLNCEGKWFRVNAKDSQVLVGRDKWAKCKSWKFSLKACTCRKASWAVAGVSKCSSRTCSHINVVFVQLFPGFRLRATCASVHVGLL